MSRPPHAMALPTIDGVSPSCVALPSGPWPTVLDFLAERIPAVARGDWQQRMRQGGVVDAQGISVPPEAPYRPQTRLYYWRQLPFEHAIPVREHIVFHDEHLLIADKPHFLPVTPKGRYLQETLLVRLKRRLGIDTLVPMHRLDRETAGLVAFTIQPATRDAYQSLFRRQAVHKVYEAVAPLNPRLALPLRHRSRLAESAGQFMSMREVPGEPNADTVVELLDTRGALGLYRLSPLTGRKHQLRAHLHALGIPILNDRIYPTLLPEPPPDAAPDIGSPLQLLARHLAFDDPITGQPRRFTSGLNLAWPPSPAQG